MNEDRIRLLNAIEALENKGNKLTKEELKELQQLRALRDSGKDIREIAIQSIKVEKYKQKLQEELKNIDSKLQEMQLELSKNKSDEDNLMKKTIENLKNSKFNISSKISKCNIVISNLEYGKDWNEIDLAIERYEGKFKLPIKIEKEEKRKEEKINLDKLYKESQNENVEYIELEEQPKERRHFSISKWLKNKFENIRKNKRHNKRHNKRLEEIEELVVEEIKEEPKEEVKADQKENPNVKFKNYIRWVASEGYEQADKKVAQIKLQERKEEARKREAEKYKGKYEEMR